MIGVYIARDVNGEALYVGASVDIDSRLDAHRTSSPWWSQVASIERVEAASRSLALLRERELIRELQPAWNRKGVGRLKIKTRNVGPIVRPRLEALAAVIDFYGSVPLLARAIGCNPQTVSDFWRGTHYPSSKVIARLIFVSGMPFDELFYIEASDVPAEQWQTKRAPRKAAS